LYPSKKETKRDWTNVQVTGFCYVGTDISIRCLFNKKFIWVSLTEVPISYCSFVQQKLNDITPCSIVLESKTECKIIFPTHSLVINIKPQKRKRDKIHEKIDSLESSIQNLEDMLEVTKKALKELKECVK
jgi:hypothetical protein